MTLRTKLNRVIIAIFILAALLYAALVSYFQQQHIETTADKITVFLESIANNNNKSLANELFEKRRRAIKLRLESITNIEGIDQAAVFGAMGERIAGSGKNDKRLTLPQQDRPSTAQHQINDNNLIFLTPIRAYDKTFGFLLLKYPLEDLRKQESRNLAFFTLGIFLFMLLTLILINAFTRKSIVNPINNLIAVMRDVKTGSFGRQLEVTGSDEVRELSLTFNRMSEKISESYVNIKKTRLFVEQIINTIDSILISIEADNRITAWNTAAIQYTGISKHEAVGKDLFLIFSNLQKFESRVKNSIHHGKPEFIHRQRIDDIFFNIFIYPLPNSHSSGALIRLDDITEQEKKENQLRQSQKMETVGQLAGGVAHDFNNMLSGIMGATELLKLKNLSPEATRYLDIILDSGKRAADLTAKLLAFSRKNKLEIQTLDVHDTINAAIAILKHSINKNIIIHTEFQAVESVIDGDLTELQNSFLNLGINASQAMPEGGEIYFSTRLVDLDEIPQAGTVFDLAPGTYIEVNVTDAGEGIPAEHINTIFEPFFTTKTQGKGTGLGLSAVYGTVQQLHGAVIVESSPDSGTTFHLYFPVSDQPQLIVADNDHQSTVLETGEGYILVVDDEEVVRMTAKALLRALGYNVLTAKNGIEARNIFLRKDENIDLVLMDMIMPEMNGTDCFMALRKIDPQVKVILCSGFTPDEELNKLKNRGLAGFIPKPYQLAELGKVVADVLRTPPPAT